MQLSLLKARLSENVNLPLRIMMPNGDSIPAHAHVTEVARVDKRFIDCGGTLREESTCRLQTWVADDIEHRLIAGKLLGILGKAGPVLLSEDLEVDIEYERGVLTQSPLDSVRMLGNEIVLELKERHTACLAPEKCLPGRAPGSWTPFKPIPTLNLPMKL
jgi:hypothetical protein